MKNPCALWLVNRVADIKRDGYSPRIVSYWTGSEIGHTFVTWEEFGAWYAADDTNPRKALPYAKPTARGLAEAFLLESRSPRGTKVTRAKFEYEHT